MSTQAPSMKPIEMIAQGLQGLVHEAAETAAQKVKEELRKEFGPRFDRVDARLDGWTAASTGWTAASTGWTSASTVRTRPCAWYGSR